LRRWGFLELLLLKRPPNISALIALVASLLQEELICWAEKVMITKDGGKSTQGSK